MSCYLTSMKDLFKGRITEVRKSSLLVSWNNENIELPFDQITNYSPKQFKLGDIVQYKDARLSQLASNEAGAMPKPLPIENLKKWNWFLREVRNFFFQQGFIEIKTPSLVICPGTEPSLDVFETELKIGSKSKKMFLPTSPELHLKKALVRGASQIFEITSSFRNGEITNRHQPEFFILEWYRSFEDLEKIKLDCQDLIRHLLLQKRKDFAETKGAATKPETAREHSLANFLPGHESKTVAQLFREKLNFEFKPETDLASLKKLGLENGVDLRAAESIDDFFFLIFMDKIEHQWNEANLLFVEKYPPYQAALACLTEDGWGDRFELYWRGYELANAFRELNDPKIQRERFLEDIEKKRIMGKQEVPVDEDFLQHLEMGMPPSAGIALGLDRLFMVLFGLNDIRDIHAFPYT